MSAKQCRIHDMWPIEHEPRHGESWDRYLERPYCVQVCDYTPMPGSWTETWLCDVNGIRAFKRRCDAARIARLLFPDHEVQHWVTI